MKVGANTPNRMVLLENAADRLGCEVDELRGFRIAERYLSVVAPDGRKFSFCYEELALPQPGKRGRKPVQPKGVQASLAGGAAGGKL